jgi:hypothetical protein
MNVSAVIVTRGDVDLSEILDSFPDEWERVVWDNGRGECRRSKRRFGFTTRWNSSEHGHTLPDESVFGRYSALEHGFCHGDVVMVQDDDCLLPRESLDALVAAYQPGQLVANMPERFRPHYPDSCLVGFGAIFRRDLPLQAFSKFLSWQNATTWNNTWGEIPELSDGRARMDFFHRTGDVVFTALTPHILLDLPYRDLPWATDKTRMYRQPDHVGERARMLELCRQVRDAG